MRNLTCEEPHSSLLASDVLSFILRYGVCVLRNMYSTCVLRLVCCMCLGDCAGVCLSECVVCTYIRIWVTVLCLFE